VATGSEPPEQERCAQCRKFGPRHRSTRLGLRRCPAFDPAGRGHPPFHWSCRHTTLHRNRRHTTLDRNHAGESAGGVSEHEPVKSIAEYVAVQVHLGQPSFLVGQRVQRLKQRRQRA
jgi:hypothetical protein